MPLLRIKSRDPMNEIRRRRRATIIRKANELRKLGVTIDIKMCRRGQYYIYNTNDPDCQLREDVNINLLLLLDGFTY